MKKILFLSLALLGAAAPSMAATCSGGPNCRACKNCKYCKHCAKEGGTCSVCAKYDAQVKAKALKMSQPIGQETFGKL